MKKLINNITMIGLWRYIFTAIGATLAIIEPILPLFYICLAFIFIDCYSAWSLSRRVRQKFADKSSGKFKSIRAGKVIVTIIKSLVAITLAYFVQKYIVCSNAIDVTKITTGAIIFWQAWSILENESSCNESKWAVILQKIMVDKTERHFDIDLSMLRNDIKQENG